MRPRNSSHLGETAALCTIARRLLSLVAPHGTEFDERVVSPQEVVDLSVEPGWITAGASPDWGVSVLCRDIVPIGSPLTRARFALQLARAVRLECGEGVYGENSLMLTPGGPASAWSCVELSTSLGPLWCAGVLPLQRRTCGLPGLQKVVRLKVFLHVKTAGKLPSGRYGLLTGISRRCHALGNSVAIGETISLGSRLSFEIPEEDVAGDIEVRSIAGSDAERSETKEGVVIMTVAGEVPRLSEEGKIVSMRIDVGSLELSLAELAALKPGTCIEIEGALPAPCFLRVGATVLAQGILDWREGEFLLRIEQVCE